MRELHPFVAVFAIGRGIRHAPVERMPPVSPSFTREQRETVRQLLHAVLMCDMGSFTPETFKHWVQDMDARFRTVTVSLGFQLRNRSVQFTIKDLQTGRTAFRFTSDTRVRFEDADITAVAPNQ